MAYNMAILAFGLNSKCLYVLDKMLATRAELSATREPERASQGL